MTRTLRALLWVGGALAACGLLATASALLALAAVGVFATTDPAWTAALPVGGARVRVNVVGLVRLGTLPGVAHLLEGRSVRTRGGTLHFSRDGRALRVTCAPCRVRHPDLATVPLDVRAVALTVRRDDDSLDGTLVVDGIEVSFHGRLRANGIELAWQLPPTELAALYRALGNAVPEARYARIEGSVRAQGVLALPSLAGRVHWNADSLEVGGLGTEHLQYGWFRFGCAQPDGRARPVISGDGERTWAAADALGPYLAAAVLAAEDQRFHVHGGYDEEAIAEVLADVRNGRPRRGASTITQQLARTLFTGGERTAVRKLRELLYAIEMERTLGKPRILELYLNTVDWGPGVCGAKAAARAYFGKAPARLTPIEAAWLAGVLRNPHAAWEQQFGPRQPDRARATQVLMQMRDWPKRERERWSAQSLAFAPAAAARRARPAGPSVVTRAGAGSSVQASR